MKKRDFGKTFSERVVALALAISPGKVTTYGRLAQAAGAGPMASQSITSILSKAYDAGEKRIPFHRIVYANGKVWINNKHRKERTRLYKNEGIILDAKGKIQNFNDIVLDYN